LKKELSSAVNSISSIMEFSPVIQFEAVVDDISKYRQDNKKEVFAVALDKDFVPLDSKNANIKTPYPGSTKILKTITSDIETNDFILVLNNFKSDRKCNELVKCEYRNNYMKEILNGLSSLNRLKDPYTKSSPRIYNNSDILLVLNSRLNEARLNSMFASNDEKLKQKQTNQLSTIFHWKNRLISKGSPIKTSKYPYKRIVAVGDIHGDYDKLERILRHAKLINHKNQWIARDTILIQVGDLFDRDNNIKKILDLLFKLREQAKGKRSAVHLLFGNHEMFNFRYNYSCITLADINSFNGLEEREEALSATGEYGKIIRNEFNVTMVLNDSLFVHSALYPDVAEMGVDKINKRAQEILGNPPTFDELYEIGTNGDTHPLFTDPIFSDNGPLINFPFVLGDDDETICSKIEETLKLTKTKRMIVGHIVQDYGEIHTKCNNKLIYIDIGLSSYLGNFFGYLEILTDKNEVWAIYN